MVIRHIAWKSSVSTGLAGPAEIPNDGVLANSAATNAGLHADARSKEPGLGVGGGYDVHHPGGTEGLSEAPISAADNNSASKSKLNALKFNDHSFSGYRMRYGNPA
jgi:hypothetical protein